MPTASTPHSPLVIDSVHDPPIRRKRRAVANQSGRSIDPFSPGHTLTRAWFRCFACIDATKL
jgi:hypothetical protein